MQLIKAKESHIDELVKSSKEAFDSDVLVGASEVGGPPGYDSTEWHRQMMRENHLYAAVEDGAVIGGAIVFVDHARSEALYIGRIFISPGQFRKGYGMKIMTELEMLDSSIKVLKLDTPIWNTRTNSFYKKLGYIETGRDEEMVYYEKTCEPVTMQ